MIKVRRMNTETEYFENYAECAEYFGVPSDKAQEIKSLVELEFELKEINAFEDAYIDEIKEI